MSNRETVPAVFGSSNCTKVEPCCVAIGKNFADQSFVEEIVRSVDVLISRSDPDPAGPIPFADAVLRNALEIAASTFLSTQITIANVQLITKSCNGCNGACCAAVGNALTGLQISYAKLIAAATGNPFLEIGTPNDSPVATFPPTVYSTLVALLGSFAPPPVGPTNTGLTGTLQTFIAIVQGLECGCGAPPEEVAQKVVNNNAFSGAKVGRFALPAKAQIAAKDCGCNKK